MMRRCLCSVSSVSNNAIKKVPIARSVSTVTPPATVQPTCLITREAPKWTSKAVVNGEIKTISSTDYAGKYLLLFFYPLDFTFVCPTEIIAFSDRNEEFKKIGCEVVAASVDSAFTHLAWINTPREKGGIGKVNFPIIEDLTKSIASSYGVLLPGGIALRGSFIIDPNGRIRHATLNDTQIGRSVDETLRLVQAVQFADEHGEVCPVNWKPGNAAMKANPSESKAYFEKTYGEK